MKDIRDMEGKIIDTRMNDLRIYEGRCPTLRAQRDGVLYVKNHTIYQLTGYETLLLKPHFKESRKEVQTICTIPKDGSHSSSSVCGKTPAEGSGTRQ